MTEIRTIKTDVKAQVIYPSIEYSENTYEKYYKLFVILSQFPVILTDKSVTKEQVYVLTNLSSSKVKGVAVDRTQRRKFVYNFRRTSQKCAAI